MKSIRYLASLTAAFSILMLHSASQAEVVIDSFLTAQTASISAATLQPGAQNAYYQLFYRNAAANFCNSSTANFSNALQVFWP